MARSAAAKAQPTPPQTPSEALSPSRQWGQFTGWTLETIRAARDGHMAGTFSSSADLAEAAKCEPTIFTALGNRIAPHRGLPRVVECSKARIRTETSTAFAPDGQSLPAAVVADAAERMVMLGAGVGQNVWTPRPDGTRIDVRHEMWPSRSLRIDKLTGQLQAVTTQGFVDVVHGDGRWVVWSLFSAEPWQWGAIKPLSTLWAQLATGGADWQEASEIHGHAHTLGTLPEQMPADHVAAVAFAKLCEDLTTRKRSGGMMPAGGKVEVVGFDSNVWQIWSELVKQRTSEVVRCLLGQDGTITNEGGNYIKAAMLSGVRDDLVEADLGALATAATTGILVPWSIVNHGLGAAPDLRLRWLFPDREEDMRRKSLADREKAYTDAIQARRAAGFVVDQKWCDALADEFGVARAPLATEGKSSVVLAPTDVARIITVNEGRMTVGLGPIDGGEVSIAQYGQQEAAPEDGSPAPADEPPPDEAA
jgi:hypothetical protein